MKATFDNLLALANSEPSARRKLLQQLARKTEAEQKLIFELASKLRTIKVQPEQEQEATAFYKSLAPADGLYYRLLLAIQLHEVNQTKSQYIAAIREARQNVQSLKTAPLARALELLIPLVDELRAAGASWETIADTLTKKQKKILSSRKVKADYLKKTYYKYKKQNCNKKG